MSDLVVLAFNNDTDAFKMRDELIRLQAPVHWVELSGVC
jgi:uncharacterized membrane protein